MPGLHPGRAEVIIAGGAMLLAIMDLAGCAGMVVSDRGLKWGVAPLKRTSASFRLAGIRTAMSCYF